MKTSRFFLYVSLIVIVTAGAIWYIVNGHSDRKETAKADIVMYKNPGCQCCDKWASYMQGNGYSVAVVKSPNLASVKTENGIPPGMSACHTALIEDYVVEGHVPAADVKQLLKNRPEAIGVAVPGMPASSPGMNTAIGEPYKSYLITKEGDKKVYTQH